MARIASTTRPRTAFSTPSSGRYSAARSRRRSSSLTCAFRKQDADYNLSPSKWVGQNGAMDQRSISQIVTDLLRLDEQAREIDASLAQMLVGLCRGRGVPDRNRRRSGRTRRRPIA